MSDIQRFSTQSPVQSARVAPYPAPKSSTRRNPWQSGMAIAVSLGVIGSGLAPLLLASPSVAQSAGFIDVPSNYWAHDFITRLADQDVIAGFPDGSFRPNDPVTRSQFAAMVRKAFRKQGVRGSVSFVDVSSSYWGYTAIQSAYSSGFMAGYPGGVFRPEQQIPRVQVLVSLSNGLDYFPSQTPDVLLQTYLDSSAIPNYARSSVAAATEKRIVVNYPDLEYLNPNQVATRADVAAFIYQAMVSNGSLTAIASPFIVGGAIGGPVANNPQPARPVLPSGVTLPVRYDQAQKILLAPGETVPLTVTVSQNIVSPQGSVLIPVGSRVVGQLQPTQGGTQFVASELLLTTGQRYNFTASSQTLTQTETIDRGVDPISMVKGTLFGAGAAAIVSGVVGDHRITAGKVLSGAGGGAAIAAVLGRKRVNLLVVNPNTDLTLTLGSNLTLN